jgi:hypothetical protein
VEVGARVALGALLALLSGLVLGWPWLVLLSSAALGGLYGAELALDDAPLDAAAALVAAGLLLTVELAYWSLEERDRVPGPPGDGLRRLAYVALVGLGALATTATLLALVDAVRAKGLAVDLLGAAAAAAVLVAVVAAAHGRVREGR